jgi:type II secretory pathway component PulL
MPVQTVQQGPVGFSWGFAPNPDIAAQGGVQQQLTRLQEQGANYRAGLSLQGELAPVQLKRDLFGQVFPWLQNSLNNLGQGTSYKAGGPALPSSQVYTGQQQQQLLNSTVAGNDQTAAAQNLATQNRLAGKGFGANSPLAQSLMNQTNAQALAQNSQARQQIPFQIAGANAQQADTVAGLANQQYTAQLDAYNKRQNALVAALASIV